MDLKEGLPVFLGMSGIALEVVECMWKGGWEDFEATLGACLLIHQVSIGKSLVTWDSS